MNATEMKVDMGAQLKEAVRKVFAFKLSPNLKTRGSVSSAKLYNPFSPKNW